MKRRRWFDYPEIIVEFFMICLAICCLLWGTIVYGEESPRFKLERDRVQVVEKREQINPEPQTEALPPPTAEQLEEPAELGEPGDKPAAAPVDNRPVVYFYRSRGCQAGIEFGRAIDRGELPSWRFVEKPWEKSPAEICPTLHFQGKSGQWYRYPNTVDSYNGTAGFIAAYNAANPGWRIPPCLPAAAAGKSPVEQMLIFAGESGSFEFKPDSPITATMDDGTKMAYSVIRGKYRYNAGKPIITLADPMPKVSVTKFMMRFGATIQGGQYEPPSSIAIDTTRGHYRIELKEISK